MLGPLWRDLTHGLMALLRAPGLCATAILTLALGTGANVAVFSVVEHALLRRLPVPAPEELVNLSSAGPKAGGTSANSGIGGADSVFSYPLFRDLERAQRPFTGIAAHRGFDANVTVGRDASHETGWLVSGTYFPVLGLQPGLGRLLTPDDDRSIGGHAVAVISHELWTTRFAGNPSAVGQSLLVNGSAMTIVGVTPPDFVGTTIDDKPTVFVPLTMAGLMRPGWAGFDDRLDHWLYLFARLKPDVTAEAAVAALAPAFAGILRERELPAHRGGLDTPARAAFVTRRLDLEPGALGQRGERDRIGRMAVMLISLTAVVLVIACANVANLLLARGTYRIGELRLRLALGASRSQVTRHLLAEACLLAGAGAVAGVGLAVWMLTFAAPLLPGHTTFEFHLNGPMLGFTVLIAVTTAVLAGLYPAVHGARASLVRDSAGRGRGTRRVRMIVTTAQFALSLSLLLVAGLFIRSIVNVRRTELGVVPAQVVTFRVSPELSAYTPERVRLLVDRVREDLTALPGVSGVTMSTIPLFGGYGWARNVTFESGSTASAVFHAEIAPDYFRTLRVPLLAGREFRASDTNAGAPVAIVNESLLRRWNVGTDALGRRMALGAGNVPMDIEIVGIVADARYSDIKDPPPPQFYRPYAQLENLGALNFYVRSSGPQEQIMAAIPRVLQRIDGALPLENLRTMEQQILAAAEEDRTLTGLAAAFALLALALAAVGLYGVLSYSVAQRRREFAVRAAVGAAPGRIHRLVLRGLVPMTVVGGAVGVVTGLALARLSQSFLYGIAGPDWPLIAAAATVSVVVSIVSATVPAYRAARVDPVEALKVD